MTVFTCVSPENIITGASTPTTLKITPATSARRTIAVLEPAEDAGRDAHERGGQEGEDKPDERQRHHEEGVPDA